MDAPNSSNTRNKLHTYKLAETWGQCVNSWVSIGYPPNVKDSRIGFRYLKKEKKKNSRLFTKAVSAHENVCVPGHPWNTNHGWEWLRLHGFFTHPWAALRVSSRCWPAGTGQMDPPTGAQSAHFHIATCLSNILF